MPRFEVEHDGSRYEVEAANEAEALALFDSPTQSSGPNQAPIGDTSPVPYTPTMGVMQSNIPGDEPVPVDATAHIGRDARAGINVHSNAGLPSLVRLRAGLTPDPKARMQFYAPYIAKNLNLPQGTDPSQYMRVSPTDHKSVQYFDSANNRWTPVDSYGPTIQDAPDIVSGLAAGGLGLVGAAVTGGASVPVQMGASAVTGGAANLGVNELRAQLADKFGVKPYDRTNAERASDVAIGGAIEAAPVAGLATLRAVKGWFRGWKPALNDGAVEAIVRGQQRLDSSFIDEVNNHPDVVKFRQDSFNRFGFKKWEDFKFNPRLDQFTEGGANEAAVAAANAAGDVSTRQAMGKALVRNFDILDVYRQAIEKPFMKPGVTDTPSFMQQAGRQGQVALDKEYAQTVGAAQQQAATATGRAQNASSLMPEGMVDPDTTGGLIRQSTMERQRVEKGLVDSKYANWRTIIGEADGTSPHKLELSPDLVAYRDKLEKLAQVGIIEEQRVPFKRLKVEGRKTPAGSILDEKGEPMIPEGPEMTDLATLDDAIKRLRQAHRAANWNQNDIGLDKYERETLLRKMVNMREDYLEKNGLTDAQAALHDAEKSYAAYAEKYKEGFVGDLLRRDARGNPYLSNQGIVTQMLQDRNGPAMQALVGVAKDSPELMNQLRQAAFADYRRSVMKDGAIDDKLHREYMQRNKGIVGQLFSGPERNLLDKVGGYAALAVRSQKKAEAAQKEWDTALGGKLKAMDAYNPAGIVKAVFQNGQSGKTVLPSDLEYLKGLMRKHTPSGVWSLQAGVGQEIRNRIVHGNTILPDGIDKLIREHGAEVKTIMGEKYFNNLKTLRNAAVVVAKNPDGLSNDIGALAGNRTLQGALKTYEGPLSKGGRLINFGIEMRKRAMAHKIYMSLTDVEEFNKWVGQDINRLAGYKNAQQVGAVGMGVYKSEVLDER